MKMTIIIIFHTLLLNSFCLAQDADSLENYLYWNEAYRLTWTDFEELPLRHSEHAAYSVVGYKSQIEIDTRYYKANIQTYFDRNESWARNWVPILLSHEQGHFDLAELYARKFREKLKEAMQEGNLSINQFKQMNEEIRQLLEEAHKEYDSKTNYSMDFRAQKKWNERIQQELKQLEEFANPEIVVTRKTN